MISLLHPSRGRPDKSLSNACEWVAKAGCAVELVLSLDESDPTYKRYDKAYTNIHLLSEYEGYDFTYQEICNNNNSVVDATNHAAKVSRGDILVYLSDDFKCFDNWGVAVEKAFEGEGRPLLIKVDDCLQKFTVPVLTIPIMNRSLYERLGYFWHPEYKSMFVDEDLYWTTYKMGAMKMCPLLKFPHEHPANGKAPDDEIYRRSAANWEQGKAVFKRRQAQGFPL
jgi:hypothetical protein